MHELGKCARDLGGIAPALGISRKEKEEEPVT